jgi:hypothetical protein
VLIFVDPAFLLLLPPGDFGDTSCPFRSEVYIDLFVLVISSYLIDD